MNIERKTDSYAVYYIQQKREMKTLINDVSDKEEIISLVRRIFKGRFKRPAALSVRDGVRILIKRFDHVNHKTIHVFDSRIYNKSVRQAKCDLETSIINLSKIN